MNDSPGFHRRWRSRLCFYERIRIRSQKSWNGFFVSLPEKALITTAGRFRGLFFLYCLLKTPTAGGTHGQVWLYLRTYLTVILRGRAGYELIYITNEAVSRVGYYRLISGKSEKNICFSKFSSNSLDFFVWNLLKSWHFLYRRRHEKNFSDLQNFRTRNSSSVFPYLVKLNDNGSYDGLREPIRKLENHYHELKIY